MAVQHAANTRSNLALTVLNDIGNSGQLKLYTSLDVGIATLTLPTTSGAVAGAVLTFGAFADDTNAAGGETEHLRIETSGGTEIYRFNSSGDGVTMSTTSIGVGDTVQVSPPFTYTAPV